MKKLKAKKRKQLRTLVLELGYIILKDDIQSPLSYPVRSYKKKLIRSFNKEYKEELITTALCKIEADIEEQKIEDMEELHKEVITYPDQHFEGF